MEAGGSDFKASCLFTGQDELLVSEMSLLSFVNSFDNLLSDLSKFWLISNLELKSHINIIYNFTTFTYLLAMPPWILYFSSILTIA